MPNTANYDERRAAVLRAVLSERQYQLRRWGRRRNFDGQMEDAPHSQADYVVLCDHYLAKAKAAFVTTADEAHVLVEVRKIAALAEAFFVHASNWDMSAAKARINSRYGDDATSMGEWLLRMESALRHAKAHSANRADDPAPAMYDLLTVALDCMTSCGAPPRVLPEVITNARDGQPA